MRLRTILGLLALITIALPATAETLLPYKAVYDLSRGGKSLGIATVELEAGQDPDCYRYGYVAKPSFLIRLLTGKVREYSQFCIEDDTLAPREYGFERDGVGGEAYTLRFDPETRTVTDDAGNSRQYPPGAVDRLLIQIAAKRLVRGLKAPPKEERFLRVTMVEDDRIKDYDLKVAGADTVKTGAGTFEAIRVERTDHPNKTVKFWVVPELDYLLVRMEQQKRDEPEIGLLLKSIPERPKAPAADGEQPPAVAVSPR